MNPGGGCFPCDCDSVGAISGAPCDPVNGQCQCVTVGDAGIGGRRCDTCLPGYYRQSISKL